MIELHPNDDRIAVVSSDPAEPLKASPIITLNREEAMELAEDLLRWAYKEPPPRKREWDSFPCRLSSFMWDSSTLRHGLFSPPQFGEIAEERIRAFLSQPKP